MLHVQELCGLRVCWLQAGQVCLEGKLGTNEYAQPNVVACTDDGEPPAYRRLGRDAVLTEMLQAGQSMTWAASANNPLVEVLRSVTLFEFRPFEARGGRLASTISELGAGKVFARHLNELNRMAAHLQANGQGTDQGRWGTSVDLQCLWVFAPDASDSDLVNTLRLAGHVDLHRLPLGMFAEKPGCGVPPLEESGGCLSLTACSRDWPVSASDRGLA